MAVSVAVCEIFSVKNLRDLENQVRGRSRSLKMASFDRPYATFCWWSIVNIALYCTIFEFFLTLNIIIIIIIIHHLYSAIMSYADTDTDIS